MSSYIYMYSHLEFVYEDSWIKMETNFNSLSVGNHSTYKEKEDNLILVSPSKGEYRENRQLSTDWRGEKFI